MNEPMTTGVTGGEDFAIDGHTASHFLAAHLSILHARILIKCADESADESVDPDDLLHEARLEAAEAQHHITLAAENSAKLNAEHLVLGLLGPLLDELELKLDAIRYRAHTPFGENPAWWRDLDLDLSDFPDDEDDRPRPESQTKTITIQTSPVEDKREPLAIVRQDRDATGTDWKVVRQSSLTPEQIQELMVNPLRQASDFLRAESPDN